MTVLDAHEMCYVAAEKARPKQPEYENILLNLVSARNPHTKKTTASDI